MKHFRSPVLIMKSNVFLISVLASLLCACQKQSVTQLVDRNLQYCQQQAKQTLADIAVDKIPGSMDRDSTHWRYTGVGSWTSGFWPGILWYLYEDTNSPTWRASAEQTTALLIPFTYKHAGSHDIGFTVMTSLGNGYRLTGNEVYKQGLLRAADSLATLFNPTVGTILSWPNMVRRMNWPHNTIVDNMMNLELLLWASKNGGDHRLYDIAVSHADVTMKHQFRPDFTTFHVAVYDTIDGHFIKGVTHQGLADESMWARGQAWAIYGFTMMYRETGEKRYLETACHAADVYLKRLPDDMIPYWDFDAPNAISAQEPRDASAAAIVASALLELSTFIKEGGGEKYYDKAVAMLQALSTPAYHGSSQNKPSFLMHCVGHMPNHSEVDASLMYADYYYIEALTRLKKLSTP